MDKSKWFRITHLESFIQRFFVVRLRRPNTVAYTQLHVLHGQALHNEVLVIHLCRPFPLA